MIPLFFFFNDTATTEIYTLSLHDALPISASCPAMPLNWLASSSSSSDVFTSMRRNRSEEHTSELQSHHDLVCRLLLEKKKNTTKTPAADTAARAEQDTAPVTSDTAYSPSS